MDKQNNDPSCPCGSGKDFDQCCKKAYDAINSARHKLKAAMKDPITAQELKKLLKQHK
ncbi:MAG: SEC-C metal-binding domain-containing protein [Bermanella sp.]